MATRPTTPEELTDWMLGNVVRRLEDEREREVVREIITPLIERAEGVSDTLKNRAALARPEGLLPSDLAEFGTAEEIAEVVAGLIETDKVTISTRGAYVLANEKPEPTPKEAARYAREILADWPEDARQSILDVFDNDAEEDV